MHYLAKHKHENCIFVSNAVLVHRLISTRCCMISSIVDSRLIFMLLYDSLNLVINAFSWGLLGAWFRGKEVKNAAAVGLCCMHNTPLRCLLGFLFCKVMQKH